MMSPNDNSSCFVCGSDNTAGLRAAFTFDDLHRTLVGRFMPRPEHQGYGGIIHGGVIASLLDEAMVKLAGELGTPAVSAKLAVRFRAPAAPGDELVVIARITKVSGRLIAAEARVERGPVVIGEAKGILLRTRRTGRSNRISSAY